jgi:hypothetical protein
MLYPANSGPRIAAVGARLACYFLITGAILQSVVRVQQRHLGSALLFEEGNLLENLQVGMLVGSTIVLLAATLKHKACRELYGLLAFLPLIATVRELDSRFDNSFGTGVWGTVVVVIIACAGWMFYRWRRRVVSQLGALIMQRSFGLMAGAILVILAMSQMIGQKAFWKAYMGTHYMREVPRAVEEFGELAGYMLLLIGVVELLLTRTSCQDDGA